MSSLSLASCPPDKLDLILQCSSQSLFLQETSPEPSQDELSAPSVAIASTNCWLPRLCSFSTVTSLEIETSPYSSLHSSILGPDTKQLLNKCLLRECLMHVYCMRFLGLVMWEAMSALDICDRFYQLDSVTLSGSTHFAL